MSAVETVEPVIVATGRRGARYIEVQATRNEDYVMVLTSRGQRYVVQADSVEYAR